MPLFFFDLFDGETTHIDDVGVDLPDVNAARRALAMTLPRISAERTVAARDRLHMRMSVRDHKGEATMEAELDWSIRQLR